MNLCYFRRFDASPCAFRADGQPDRAHMIPQQRLKAEYKRRGFTAAEIGVAVWDHRIIVPACRHHHGLFDGKQLRLSLDEYPVATKLYAAEYGWFWAGERDGWLPDRGALAA